MEYFRFSPFNNATLLIMALTAAMAAQRWRGSARSAWPAAYYAVLAGYTFGFEGSMNRWMVAAGVACAVAIRCGAAQARWLEMAVFAYVLWRGLGLLLLW